MYITSVYIKVKIKKTHFVQMAPVLGHSFPDSFMDVGKYVS